MCMSMYYKNAAVWRPAPAPQPSRQRQPTYGSSGRPREVGAILRCVLTSDGTAHPHTLVRREHAPGPRIADWRTRKTKIRERRPNPVQSMFLLGGWVDEGRGCGSWNSGDTRCEESSQRGPWASEKSRNHISVCFCFASFFSGGASGRHGRAPLKAGAAKIS